MNRKKVASSLIFILHSAWEEIPTISKLWVHPVKGVIFPTVTLCPKNSNPERWGNAIKILDHLKRKCTDER